MSASLFKKNSYIKQDRIASIHSFGNKSIANVFGLFLSIIVFKMSLAYFYSPSPQDSIYQLFFLEISQPMLFLGGCHLA